MSRGPASAVFNETAFPIAWAVAREYRRGNLTKPFEWISATRLPGEIQLLADTYEIYVTHDSGLADLGSWVLEDLPPGQAHRIDSDTDSAWAFLLLWAIRQSASESDARGFSLGPNTYATRQQLFSTLDEISARADQVAQDFKLRQLESRIIPEIRRALQQSIDQFE